MKDSTSISLQREIKKAKSFCLLQNPEFKCDLFFPSFFILKDRDERRASISGKVISGHHLTKESGCATDDKGTQ